MSVTDTPKTFLTRMARLDDPLRTLPVNRSHLRSAPISQLPAQAAEQTLSGQYKYQLLICLSLLYTTILFSTIAVPAGGKQIPISFLTGLLHFGFLAILTRGAFDVFRLLAVGAALSVVILETALVHPDFAPTSLLYVVGIYLPLVLTLPLANPGAIRTIWKHLSLISTTIAGLGLIQMLVQFLAHGMYLDPLRMLPQSVLLQGYNTTYAISYGESLLKPNGMVLLEPSFYSQMVALGLLSELIFFKRKLRILLLLAGLVASFSGTGVIMLFPALFFLGSIRTILGLAILGAVLIGVLTMLGYGTIYLNRAMETGSAGSSGHTRFVAPYQEMIQGWEQKTSACLFGKGAGVSERMSVLMQVNFGPISKVGVEYGVAGLAAFSAVWISMFARLGLPGAFIIALIIFYFLASGSFLQPFTVFTIWALTAGSLRKPFKQT